MSLASRRVRWLLGLLLLPQVALAEEASVSWHYRPAGHRLGDVHPFFHEGECWLYSLQPDTYAVTAARSRDFIHWQEQTLSYNLPQDDPDFRPFYVLGVFRDPQSGVFRSYYGCKGRMVNAQSADLWHWSRGPGELDLPAVAHVVRRRDPFVFWIPEQQQYGCVMTTQLDGLPKAQAGAVSLATSPDLKNWQDHGPILKTGTDEPECPQMFSLGGRWYLLASVYDRAVGGPSYWISDKPQGPWNLQPNGMLDGKDLCAAQVATHGDRLILMGWIPQQPARPGAQVWGGSLALPREVYVTKQGELGVRLVQEVREHLQGLAWSEPTSGEDAVAPIPPGHGGALELTCPLSQDDDLLVHFHPQGSAVISANRLQLRDGQGVVWSELKLDPPLKGEVSISLLVEQGITELFVNDQYALAARLPADESASHWSIAGAIAIRSVRTAHWKVAEGK